MTFIFLSFLFGLYELAAAAPGKSLQLCPTLCDPMDGSLPGSPIPGTLLVKLVTCTSSLNPLDDLVVQFSSVQSLFATP